MPRPLNLLCFHRDESYLESMLYPLYSTSRQIPLNESAYPRPFSTPISPLSFDPTQQVVDVTFPTPWRNDTGFDRWSQSHVYAYASP